MHDFRLTFSDEEKQEWNKLVETEKIEQQFREHWSEVQKALNDLWTFLYILVLFIAIGHFYAFCVLTGVFWIAGVVLRRWLRSGWPKKVV